MYRWIMALAVFALSLMPAAAQTTQPAPHAWIQDVNRLAEAMVSDDGAASLETMVPDDALIRRFNSTEAETCRQLHQQTGGLIVVSARAYDWPAEGVAANLAADVRDCQRLPESIRRQFVPKDDNDAKRANATAQQWLAATLRPQPGQLVALVMLWEPQSLTASLLTGSPAGEPKQPIFIMIKAHRTTEEEYHITQIAYGDVGQALN